MTQIELQALIRDEAAFISAFRKDTFPAILAGKFAPGRVPYMHTVTLEDGSRIVLKFTNTVKILLNSKLQPIFGKESFLSYFEVIVAPVGMKAYVKTFDPKQIVWAPSKANAQVKHDANIALLVEEAAKFGIDLSVPANWNTAYSENY